MIRNKIAESIFGSTGRKVTRVGLGGEGILRTHGHMNQARGVIQEALKSEITYFDSARAYADSEVYYGSLWNESPESRAGIFQTSKSASRDKKGAMSDLENTLERMGIDSLDLWQIHDVRTTKDLDLISARGGALEAFVQARASGRVRFVGVTGHHDPAILTRAVNEWPVDAVMFPVNPIEGCLGGFMTSTYSAAKEKGIAIIGMKVLGGGHFILPALSIPPRLLIRFALSHDITVAIVGCSTPEEVQILAEAGREEVQLSESEKNRLLKIFQPYATRLAFYRGVL